MRIKFLKNIVQASIVIKGKRIYIKSDNLNGIFNEVRRLINEQ